MCPPPEEWNDVEPGSLGCKLQVDAGWECGILGGTDAVISWSSNVDIFQSLLIISEAIHLEYASDTVPELLGLVSQSG